MNLLLLLYTFFKIGLLGIGGGYAIIPMIQSQVVQQLGWLNEQTFADIITISQMTPGPLTVNTSTFVGIQIAGIPGAVCATIGCIIPGICISIGLYLFFRKHTQSVYAQSVLDGLKAASAGLILSAAATMLLLAFTSVSTLSQLTQAHFDIAAGIVFVASFVALRKFKLNPMLLMLITGALGILLYGIR